MKYTGSRGQISVAIDVLKILLEYASKLKEFSLRYLLDQIILVLRIVEERATFS